MHDIGLAEALANVEASMRALAPVLTSFRGPFVLHAVAVPAKNV